MKRVFSFYYHRYVLLFHQTLNEIIPVLSIHCVPSGCEGGVKLPAQSKNPDDLRAVHINDGRRS